MPQLDQEKLCCSICLELLKDPVTLPCGHSYCRICIKNHWDGEDHKGVHTCPQCRKNFIPRPVLGKNTMLAELVEELKNTELQAAPPDHDTYAGPGDVPCDFCTGKKQKATNSCLQCLVSYCDIHLQPHFDSQAFQSHKLVKASANLQENICSLHSKVKEDFCRNDKQCICYLCSMNEHKGHDIVSIVAERDERQNELDLCRKNIQERIQDLEKDLAVLQNQMGVISGSADEAARNCQMMFSQLVQLIERRSSEVQHQIRSQQETEAHRVKELDKKLQHEISELKKKEYELEQLSYTEDHNQFLLTFYTLPALSESTHSNTDVHPLSFKEVTAGVSRLKEKLQDLLSQDWNKISLTEGEVLPRPAEPRASMKQQTHLVLPPQQQPPAFRPQEGPTPTAYQHRVVPPPPQQPPSFKPQEGPTPTAYQQPRVVPPTPQQPPSFKPQEGPTPIAYQQPRVVPPDAAVFVPKAQHKNSLKQTPLGPPEDPKSLVPQQPALIPQPVSFAPPAEPKTRGEFLHYSLQITMDPNTMSKWLSLSEGNRKVTYMKKEQLYSDHPERFSDSFQVLSREALTGRHYWEVKWNKFVSVAVAYKSISRTGIESEFGFNDKSWALWCRNNEFKHGNNCTFVSVPQSCKIGVYVDHSAGVLCFFSVSVSDSMTLLHKVETTFTEPLHAGLWVCSGYAKLI
ncbi:tripartite motif-containing protein 16-like [Archocentrus centrarchus]|uniref:tripartite motif-containing protein 16-like n=1 Tax=Archocentrus centrarchus TaxID=63155 RepID=UPI0011EA0832|nr:tripartite motif-containing protein 16-like [Archocentrus centrarchus]